MIIEKSFQVLCEEKIILGSTQEEADTKVFLCAKHASDEYQTTSACITTVDSDIALYALYFDSKIEIRMYINYIVAKRSRIIDVHSIALEIGLDCCSSIPALHAFSGNGYTSAFYGIGNAKMFRLMRQYQEFQDAFTKLGDTFEFDANLFKALEQFVCRLYDAKCDNTNEARNQKLCSSIKVPEPQKLPSTRDALLQHSKRVSFVTAIVKRSLENSPIISSLVGNSWKIENNSLVVDWLLLPVAPADVIDQISCNCKNSMCRTLACECKSHGFKCADLCGCRLCENEATEEIDSDAVSDDSDFNNDDDDYDDDVDEKNFDD